MNVPSIDHTDQEFRLFSLVLAAGKSQRFGSPKQLARYRGQSLLMRATELAASVTGPDTLLVVGADWPLMIDEYKSGTKALDSFIALNEDFEAGMASSIVCGIRSILTVADAVMIVLADQPLITADHLLALMKEWQSSSSAIVASEFADIVGPPVIFPAACFPSLLKLQGDQGARKVIEENKSNVIGVPFAEAAVDIDTPEDLRMLQ